MILTIFFGTLVSYLIVGYIVSKKAKHLDDYYVTGRNAGPIFVMGTFAATWISAIGILAYPGASYAYGLGAIVMWGAFPGFVLATLTIVPKLYRSGAWTLFDMFGKRWDDKKLTGLGIIFMFFGLIPYALSQVMGGATILSGVTGVDYYTMLIISSIAFCLITLVGGAWSVTVTDTMMMAVILLVAFGTLPFALTYVGGWDNIMWGQFAAAPQRFTWTGAGLTAGGAISVVFIWMCGMFAAPHQSSRILIAKDEKTAIKGLILAVSLGLLAIWSFHIMASGLWSVKPDLKNSSQAMIYLFQNLPNTVVGAMGISGLFAAALSTITAMLLTLAMGLGKDLVKTFIDPNIPDEKLLKLTKYAVVGWSLLLFAAAWMQMEAIAKWGELGASVFACVYFPPLILGVNWKRVTKTAVYWSMIVGGGVDIILWIAWRMFGMPLIAGIQPVIYGIVSAFIVIIGVSLVTTPTAKELAEYERLQIPVIREGVDHSDFKYYCGFAVIVGIFFIVSAFTLLPH